MPSTAASTDNLQLLERIVIASVGVTARAVADAAPELSLLQWRVLVVLAGNRDGVTVTELAERLGSRLSATSRLLGRMRRRDLVEMRKDHADARVTTVLLAVDGESLWRRVVERRREDLENALATAALAPDDGQALERLARAFGAFA